MTLGRGIILGIDFSTEYTQMAILDEDGNPQCISIGVDDNFLIPTAVYHNEELDEWSAGDEAVNKSRLGKDRLYTSLPYMLVEKRDHWKDAVYAFISYLLKVAVNYCNGRLIKNILISVENPGPKLVGSIVEVMEALGYDKSAIRVVSHSESFVYYVLNQSRDIWVNGVYFLNYTSDGFTARRLDVMRGRAPYLATVDVDHPSYMPSLESVKSNPKEADRMLFEYMTEKLKSHVISGVYLAGEGFFGEGWEKSLSLLCGNRRVFRGNNLVVKGAAYGAKECFLASAFGDYIISCSGRTKARVTMTVQHNGNDHVVVLSDVGEYWYQSESSTECIVEEPGELSFDIWDAMTHESRAFTVDISKFPRRPSKTTRIGIYFKYISEYRFEVSVKDLGFGEFFPASGMEVSKEIGL